MKTKQPKPSTNQGFVQSDLLTHFIKEKLHLNIGLVTFLLVLALNLPLVAYASVTDTWYSKGNRLGLLHEYAWWIYQISSIPATSLFFLWMPDGIFNVFDGLRKNKAILSSGDQNEIWKFNNFIDEFNRIYSHWLIIFISLISTAIYMIVAVIPEHRGFNNWFNLNLVTFWYGETVWYLLFSLGTMIIIRILIAIYWFNRLFKEFKIDVKVLHPDGAGGLSPLGSFSTKIGYLIGIFAASTIVSVWSHTNYLLNGQPIGFKLEPATFMFLILYIFLAPVVFFAPIGSAHWAMRTAKEDFLLRIADQFEVDFKHINKTIAANNKKLAENIEKIEQLQKIHKIVSSFPIWPFNTTNVIRFFSSTFSPFVFAVIPTLIQLILG